MSVEHGLEETITAYRQALDSLDDLLKTYGHGARQDSVRSKITARLESVFLRRDSLETALTRQPEAVANRVAEIAALDERLIAGSERALAITRINLFSWRRVLASRGEPAWWWSIDTAFGGQLQAFPSLGRLFAFLLSVVVLGIAFTIITLQTTRLFAQDLNVLGGITLVAQVLIGGGLANKDIRLILMKLVRSLYNLVPARLLRLPAWLPGPSPLLLFSIVFLAVVLLVNYGFLPWLAAQMHQAAIYALEAENLGQAQANLEIAVRLVPDYAVSLTQLGILYDSIGDRERAVASFEQALAADSQLLLARYRLAELYLDDEGESQIDRALRLLDYGLTLVQRHLAEVITLPIGSEEELQIQHYLLLIARSHAFLELGRPAGGLIDLAAARRLTEQYPDLFIVDTEIGVPSANDERALSTFELNWLTALALEMVYTANPGEENRINADRAWETVQTSADPVNSSQERLRSLIAADHLP